MNVQKEHITKMAMIYKLTESLQIPTKYYQAITFKKDCYMLAATVLTQFM